MRQRANLDAWNVLRFVSWSTKREINQSTFTDSPTLFLRYFSIFGRDAIDMVQRCRSRAMCMYRELRKKVHSSCTNNQISYINNRRLLQNRALQIYTGGQSLLLKIKYGTTGSHMIRVSSSSSTKKHERFRLLQVALLFSATTTCYKLQQQMNASITITTTLS